MGILTSESKTTLTIKRDAIIKLIAEDLGVQLFFAGANLGLLISLLKYA